MDQREERCLEDENEKWTHCGTADTTIITKIKTDGRIRKKTRKERKSL